MKNEKYIIKTSVSKAHWCLPGGQFKGVYFSDNSSDNNRTQTEIFWFDELLKEGLFIPEKDQKIGRPLFILLSGPPGSGKTTLALELRTMSPFDIFRKKLHSFYNECRK